MPLAVAGAFVGCPWSGRPVVTKGGLVGDAGTTAECVAHLRRAAVAARPTPTPAPASTPAPEPMAAPPPTPAPAN